MLGVSFFFDLRLHRLQLDFHGSLCLAFQIRLELPLRDFRQIASFDLSPYEALTQEVFLRCEKQALF